MEATGPMEQKGSVQESVGVGGGASVLTGTLGPLESTCWKKIKLEGLGGVVWEYVKNQNTNMTTFREISNNMETLGKWFNGMFYNRNELYSYSKFNIYKKLQQTNVSYTKSTISSGLLSPTQPSQAYRAPAGSLRKGIL